MNGDDILRTLEAKRDALDQAIAQMRGILLLLTGPAVPENAVLVRRKPEPASHHRGGTVVPDSVAADILAYVGSEPAPVAADEILSAVRGAKRDHLRAMTKAGRLGTIGKTTATRYTVPVKAMKTATTATVAATPAVVWNGSNGGSLSSYQQKARG